MQKRILLLALSLFLIQEIFAQNQWTQRSDCPLVTSHGTVFSIGTKAYFGSGWNGSSHNNQVWEYDTDTDSWNQKSSAPWQARGYAVAISIDGMGYFGLGLSNGVPLKDWWKYDPVNDLWTPLAPFPGISRYGAIAFPIGTNGYVGIGKDSLNNDTDELWEYNTLTDTWMQKADFEGVERAYAVGFSIDGKGYVGSGYVSGATFDFPLDFWEYDPLTNLWSQKADFGNPRLEATGFSMNGKGYIGTGGWGIDHVEFFEYDPVTNDWEQKADFGGLGRDGAVGFSVGNRGYIGSGHSNANYFNDFWEYAPDSGVGMDEQGNTVSASVSPNPFSKETIIKTAYELNEAQVIIVDLFGNEVQRITSLSGHTITVTRGKLSNGVYLAYIVQQDKLLEMQKLFITE